MTEPLDVVELLIRDHRLMDGLLAELETEDRPAEVRRLYLRIVGEIAAHEAAEHDVVFPALRAVLPADAKEARDRIAEHDEVNSLLSEMQGMNPAGFGFTKRASALCLELQSHFEAEEETVFPRLRAAYSHDELVELGRRVLLAKQCAPCFPAVDEHDDVAPSPLIPQG